MGVAVVDEFRSPQGAWATLHVQPTVVWSIVLRAAARMISVFAACRDLANAPSQQAVFDALEAGLPRTLPVLEKRLNGALTTTSWSRRLQRRSWQIAIDWH